MEDLSPLDAGFLEAEDGDEHASLAIASVTIAAGPVPPQEELVEAIASRLRYVPRYRQRIRRTPLNLGPPVWVDDHAFDLSYHVRRTALPAPGDEQALCRLVARIMSQRLDHDRPLWECWVIEGLAGGEWAVLLKVHHCMIDGIAGIQLLGLIFDAALDPGDETASDTGWDPEPEPSTSGLLLRSIGAILRSPAAQWRLLNQGLRSPVTLAQSIYATSRGIATFLGSLTPVAKSSLTGPIGRPRRYSVARARRSDLIEVAHRYGVTVNDVVLAAIGGGFRTLLLHRGERPDAESVRALVPVSVRRGNRSLDNRISMMLPMLPVDVADPVQRLERVHEHLMTLKASNEIQAGLAVTTLARYEPFIPVSWAVRLVARLPQRQVVAVTTNVPGPREPLSILGRPIRQILPYVPIALRIRTGVAVMTYQDQVTVGVTADFDSGPEVDLLAEAIAASITELVEGTRSSKSSRSRKSSKSSKSGTSQRPSHRAATPQTSVRGKPRAGAGGKPAAGRDRRASR
jgi:diacylglycerol O-acyltransferase